MSKLICAVLGASLGFATCAPLYAAEAGRSEAWPDSQVRAALDKCKSAPANERAKCIVNIRPAGGGGSSVAVAVADSRDAKTVKAGVESDEEYMAAIKQCDSSKDKERCIADVKDHFGRM
jgi:hypothetical protein